MVWQDLVISGASIIFSYSLLYQVYKEYKEKTGLIPLQTSGLMCLGSVMLTASFFSLGLYISASLSGFLSTLWAILFFQKINYGK